MKNLIITSAIILISLSSFGQSKCKNNDMPRTHKIASIEYGVQCGKTGKSAVYVYYKEKNTIGFNPAKDRKIVYTENLSNLKRTVEYQSYIKSI